MTSDVTQDHRLDDETKLTILYKIYSNVNDLGQTGQPSDEAKSES